MLTLDATLRDPDVRESVQDINFGLTDGLDSVRKRVIWRLQFWTRQWFMDRTLGLPVIPDILGRQFDVSIAQQAIATEIRAVPDVLSVTNVTATLTPETRVLRFTATVETVFGETTLESTF